MNPITSYSLIFSLFLFIIVVLAILLKKGKVIWTYKHYFLLFASFVIGTYVQVSIMEALLISFGAFSDFARFIICLPLFIIIYLMMKVLKRDKDRFGFMLYLTMFTIGVFVSHFYELISPYL